MPHVHPNPDETCGRSFRNKKGDTQCVELIKQTLGAPCTALWRPGRPVSRENPLPRGTAIATFVDGKYPQTGSSGMHAAIYLEQNESGVVVLDQWKAQGEVRKRTLRWTSQGSPSNTPLAFSEIEW